MLVYIAVLLESPWIAASLILRIGEYKVESVMFEPVAAVFAAEVTPAITVSRLVPASA
jgi:hypothetical protein